MDHLVTFRIIVEECRNDKSSIFCCFVDFIKGFKTIPRNNLWNRLEELKVPFGLRVVAISVGQDVAILSNFAAQVYYTGIIV